MLRKDLESATEVRIQFLEKGTTNVIMNYEVLPGETEELSLWRNAITRRNTKHTKCSPGGKIIFYKKAEILLEADFQLEEGCMNASFVYRNTLYFKKLSDEAIAWLEEKDKEYRK